MSRQHQKIRIGLYYFNDDFRAFSNGASEYGIWDINYDAQSEFQASTVDRALSGKEIGGISAYRITINTLLRNTLPSDSEKLRKLLSSTSSRFPRKAHEFTLSNVTNVSATFDNVAETVDGYYNGLVIEQGSDKARITGYDGQTQTATLTGDTLSNGSSNIMVYPDKATILGVSTDTTTNTIIYCNLIGSDFNLLREQTINNQLIGMQLRSVNVFKEIPSYLISFTV